MVYVLLSAIVLLLSLLCVLMFFGKPIKIELRKISMTEIHESQKIKMTEELKDELEAAQKMLNERSAAIEKGLQDFNNTFYGGEINDG